MTKTPENTKDRSEPTSEDQTVSMIKREIIKAVVHGTVARPLKEKFFQSGGPLDPNGKDFLEWTDKELEDWIKKNFYD